VGDLEGSERELRRAIATFQQLIQSGRSNWDTTRSLASAHDELADTIEQQCAKSRTGECRARVLAELDAEWALMQPLHAKGVLPKGDDDYLRELAERRTKMSR